MRIMRNALAALASVAVLVVAAPAANAAFVMTLSDGVNTAVVGTEAAGMRVLCPASSFSSAPSAPATGWSTSRQGFRNRCS